MTSSDLAHLIRQRRIELRLTQRQAAERAGVSLATWQVLERHVDSRRFQPLTLARVADGLELDEAVVLRAAARATDGPAPDGPAPDGSATDGPAPDGAAPDGAAPDGPAPDGPVGDAPEARRTPRPGSVGDGVRTASLAELLVELDELLGRLHGRSQADFMLVYGQALEAADHLLARPLADGWR